MPLPLTLAQFRLQTADLPDSTPIYLADSFGDVEPASHTIAPGDTNPFPHTPLEPNTLIIVAQ